MNFLYFEGPVSDMSDLDDKMQNCSICNTYDYCFSLDSAITNRFSDEEKEEKYGCYNCLRDGVFEFWHDTEYGMLDENGLYKVYNHNIATPPPIAPERLTELKRTPQIITYQQELWLTHCNDFMIYKGVWEPEGFYNNSSAGDGRQLFMDMTDKNISNLWDDSINEGTKLNAWYATYYVFQCRHCGKMRGNWDCP